jgi:Glycosyltransferase family 9 (heptosyltransferase)
LSEIIPLLISYHVPDGTFEWRERRNFAQPLWIESNDIAGKTILLHAEQGFGDTVQFCRYVPLVAGLGARTILEVQAPLAELMTTLACDAQIVCSGASLPDFDMHCPLLSFPLALGTRIDTIPFATPYLATPRHASKDWELRLGQKLRPRIGLAWSGNPSHRNDHNRSISLRSLIVLLHSEATFVSLQKELRPDDAAVLKECTDILQFSDEIDDFSNTTALIDRLDLVISVDTSVAHLAGALGKPTWILLPFLPDFRWLLDRDDGPWYPTARLFRQDETRSWDGVIRRVHAALQDFCGASV